jgi:chaperone protein EcpD
VSLVHSRHAPLAAILCGLAALAGVRNAHAGVVLANTRVVFPGDARDVTVRLSNRNAYPVLVEAWVEHGVSDVVDTPLPFATTPPLFRIDPGKGQALRVHRLPGALATDRETLFWLNVLDVPPDLPATQDASAMKIALRTRVKLFHRPAGLPGSAAKAPGALRWRLIDAGFDSRVEIENPTPYHVTIARIAIDGGLDLHGDMVAPFGTLVLRLDAPATERKLPAPSVLERVRRLRVAGRIAFDAINDHGGRDRFEGTLP